VNFTCKFSSGTEGNGYRGISFVWKRINRYHQELPIECVKANKVLQSSFPDHRHSDDFLSGGGGVKDSKESG